jgi:hypothetical protein
MKIIEGIKYSKDHEWVKFEGDTATVGITDFAQHNLGEIVYVELPGIDAEMDIEGLHQYLTFLWVPDPKTTFRGIFKLPAGHHAIWHRGELRSRDIGTWNFRARMPYS